MQKVPSQEAQNAWLRLHIAMSTGFTTALARGMSSTWAATLIDHHLPRLEERRKTSGAVFQATPSALRSMRYQESAWPSRGRHETRPRGPARGAQQRVEHLAGLEQRLSVQFEDR